MPLNRAAFSPDELEIVPEIPVGQALTHILGAAYRADAAELPTELSGIASAVEKLLAQIHSLPHWRTF